MSVLKLLWAEIRYRKLNFTMSVTAVTIAVALFVAGPVLVDGYSQETHARISRLQEGIDKELAKLEDETRILMRDMGFNLLIVHKDTNMADFWAEDFAVHDFPEEYVYRLAKDQRLTLVTHLVATQQQRIKWENRSVLLVGYLPEVPQAHLPHKKPMGYNIERGTVFLGFELGQNRAEGEEVEVLGRSFKIARILPEQGSKEDISICMNLRDAQELLNKPGKINQILALSCRCPGMGPKQLAMIRSQLEQVLPETRVSEFRSIALARAEQRDLVERQGQTMIQAIQQSRSEVQTILETLSAIITPMAVLGSAIWVGLLAWANVRERRSEIALWHALGKSPGKVATLFLGKAFLVGLLGGVLGLAVGAIIGWAFGIGLLGIAPERFDIPTELSLAALFGAPILAALASYLPTLSALSQDPAVILQDRVA